MVRSLADRTFQPRPPLQDEAEDAPVVIAPKDVKLPALPRKMMKCTVRAGTFAQLRKGEYVLEVNLSWI